MTIKYAWITFILAAAVTLPLRVYQLFFLIDGETDFLIGGAATTFIISVALVILVFISAFASKKDANLHVDYVPLQNGAAAFLGALEGLILIFQSANMAPHAYTELAEAEIQEYFNPVPILKMVLAFWGVAAGVVILFAAYGFLKGKNPLRRHPLIALCPSVWGCVCMVLLFVMYTSKANISQNIYNMLTITCILLFLFSQAKLYAGLEEERSVRMVYACGLPAILLALFSSLPCLLLTVLGRHVPGEFPSGMHIVTIFMAIYILAFLIMLYGLPKQKKDAESAVVLTENESEDVKISAN